MAWYGFGGKASVDEDDMKRQPAITVKTQGVNEVVRPTITAGGYKGRYNLRDTLVKFGKVKDFLDHDHTEMIVPSNLSRPVPNMATRPSWPKLPNFGIRPNKNEEFEKPKPKEDEREIPGFNNNQESFTAADKAEDSSKKRNNFWQDEDDVDSIAPTTNVSNKVGHTKPNSTVIMPTNYRGTAMDEHQLKQSYGVNNNSSNEDNSNKIKESEQRPNLPNRNGQHNNSETNPYEDNKAKHEKPNISNGGHIKKQNKEIAGFNSKTSITQESAPMHTTNISNGWQDYYYNGPLQRNVNYPQGGYNYNRAQRWNEITPNPPPQLQYGGGVYPNFRPVYRRAVIDSKWAEKKYNGILLPDNY